MIVIKLYVRIMSKTRRTFTREFKLYAVELSYERDSPVSLANELNIRAELLYRWRNKFASYEGTTFPGNVDKQGDRRLTKRAGKYEDGQGYLKKGSRHLFQER